MSRFRRVSVAVCAVLLGVLTIVPAHGAPSPRPTSSDGHISTTWDDDVINLAWHRNSTYTKQHVSFLAEPVVVPGDDIHRTLQVRNTGPCNGLLTITLKNSKQQKPNSATNDELEHIVNLYWNIAGQQGKETFANVVARDPIALMTVPISKEQQLPVTIGYEFPIAETRGRSLSNDSHVHTFDVELVLRGDECSNVSDPSPTPSPSPTPTPTATATSEPPDDGDKDGKKGKTGGELFSDNALVSAVAGIALGLGLVLFSLAKRRRAEEE